MHNINPFGLFDEYFLLEKLSKLGDPLVQLLELIDWQIFSKILNETFTDEKKNISKGGRPAFEKKMLFKGLILQSLYSLSDDQLEYQIVDRASFKRFLGLKSSDKVPDSKTFWSFRETLIKKDVIHKLFKEFNKSLDDYGVLAKEGRMIDASFVEVPRQRNTRDENKHIKDTGKAPEAWNENKNKKSQKDIDARWTKKNNVNYFGYKNHIKADVKSKLILDYEVTDASVHDSQVIEKLLDEGDKNQDLYADSAYSGEKQKEIYKQKEVFSQVNEKGYRNKKLTEEQKKNNKKKSKTRARVEHIFGFIENSMKGFYLKTIGKARVEAKLGLINLTYNICRFIQLKKMSIAG